MAELNLNAEENAIVDFLKARPNLFISVVELSKHLGNRKKFDLDRTWARPILRRMELDGVLESNPFGEYRLKVREEDKPTFKEALTKPGVHLGDTTIIRLDEAEEEKP